MKLARLFLLTGFALMCAVFSFAQTSPDEEQGLRPYDSWHGGDLDSVSMTTGALTLHIPLVSFPQRGSTDLSFFILFSSKQWQAYPTRLGVGWRPSPTIGAGIVSSVDWWVHAGYSQTADGSGAIETTWSRSVSSPDGATHSLAWGTGPVFPIRSFDATGLLMPDTNTLIMPNGSRYSYPGIGNLTSDSKNPIGHQPSQITDANGNQISISSSGWTDTMGRFLAGSPKDSNTQGSPIVPGVPTSDLSKCPSGTASALVWNVPGIASVNSGLRTYYFCFSSVSVSPVFDGRTVYQGTLSLLTAIVLPDSTEWTFTYDNYADVTQVVFPTGGSLSYQYAYGPSNCGGSQHESMWVISRTVDANDGTGPHTWNYSYSAPNLTDYAFAGTGTVTGPVVTGPDGKDTRDDTVHTIQEVAGACPGYDVQVQYYEGPASSGKLLKTTQVQYTGTVNNTPGTFSANVVPTQITTTLADGHVQKIVKHYDQTFTNGDGQPVMIGSLLQEDEYGFSSAVLRSTVNHYVWQDNATYASNNFVSLPLYSMVKDVANCELSKTSYGYDESYNSITLQSSGITEQHGAAPAPVRGNHTSTSSWLISNCAEQSQITSHSIPYDTGLPYQSFDPLNHLTQYTYDSGFYGAYLTQTNMPDTQMPDPGAPVVHHVISANYDFNTGLVTSFTDENGQVSSYSYDIMLRLAQGNHPDGGQTVLTYPDPNTVISQRKISSSVSEGPQTVKFDGLGRNYQTLEFTPSGTIEAADTTYDSVGRVSTISNAHYQGTAHSSDPTNGVTSFSYDALGRVTSTTKQDGSITQTQYDQASGDGDPSVNCIIAIDEAHDQREVCSDGLGRMVKVIEPNPGAPETAASGSVSISGKEQSSSQSGTPGTATVTISGKEKKTCGDYICPPYIWDRGTVKVTVNGQDYKQSYGTADTAHSLAANLAGVIRANSTYVDYTSIVDNATTPPSTTITIQARTNGAATNYPLSASVSYDTGDFQASSFTPSTSGANLTNGSDGTTTSDTGKVTITVNGTPYDASYGAGDSSTSIASKLATAISAGSWANAWASDGKVTITSKTLGTDGEYSLSASYTWDSTHFSSPSFTTSASGSSLSGDLGASALNNQPFVTVYQYDTLNHMIRVDQKGTAPSDSTQWRTRTFTYNSLSQLITVQNPENGTVCYGIWSAGNCISSYDANGNLLKKTNARNITVTYAYDALNRLTDKTYSDGTPKASYRYDYATFLGQSLAYPIGREVATLVAGSAPQFFTSYDRMGRVKQTTQCNPGVTGCKTFTAQYDLAGDLTSLAYPANNFSVTYGYDSAARVISATDSNGVVYAQAPVFWATGAIKEFTSPNFNNNKFHIDLNNRLEPTEIWAGTASGANALYDKQYTYNPSGQTQVNNGNVYTITNVKDSTRTQTFTYDVLNRLATAQDTSHWSNVYTIDGWGNLTKKLDGPIASADHLDGSAQINNQLTGYSYDAAGDMVSDGANRYLYDAESRIACLNPDPVSGQCNSNSVIYTYDADGRRVQKSNGANYWYGPGGAVFAETDSAGNWTNYVFFAGQRLARNVPQSSVNPADIKYYISDHLHSTAMFADQSGSILDDNDFYPWGGVVPGVGQTTSDNTVKFTGKYRDTESQLDYFGARYYRNITGRFMSPDWADSAATVPYAQFGDPQSLNLYSNARNSPIARVDADGHMAVMFTTDGIGYVGSYGVNDGSGGLPDPFRVEWQRASITTTITYTDGHTQTLVHSGDVALSGTGEWLNRVNRVYEQPAYLFTHYVSIAYFPKGANGAGHVGIGIDSDSTMGFATWKHHNFLAMLTGFPVEGELKDDDEVYGEDAPRSYLRIPITGDQAVEMEWAIADRAYHPGSYSLYFRNCAQFVEDVLHAGGVEGVPHHEIFSPPVLFLLLQGEALMRASE